MSANRFNDVVEVAAADDLRPGQLKRLTIGGRDVVIARAEHGHAAFDDLNSWFLLLRTPLTSTKSTSNSV